MAQEDIHIEYINSRNRDTGTDSDFTYTFKFASGINYDRIAVASLSCPKSYYLVQGGFNTFQVQHDTTTYTITIPPGNYTRTSFRNILQSILNDTSSFVYTITFPSGTNVPDTGHYTFTVSNNSGIQPVFIFTTNVHELLGFDRNTSYTFVDDVLESVDVVNFQLESTLYLHCDVVQNRNNDILQDIISSNVTDFGYISFTNPDIDMFAKTFVGSNSTTARFYLTNEDGTIMNLNGLNIVFTVILYKKRENIDNLIKKYIYYKLI